ncbi:di-trans,poly-cis-decaprenylcistransferase [Candidatus Saccharibacteria bacterium]|nr:di-trans,poly-cis-decaprenylcistransferase [Candidatus Saccharibacteria bacterium]
MTELRHLGVICDGNRRWAKEKGLPTFKGHEKGLSVIEEMVDAADNAGIPFISFYVFSTENWNRTAEEVGYLMKLIEVKVMGLAKKMKARNGKMVILGSKKKVDPKLLSMLEKAEKITEDCTGITVGICFNYGGEQEIAEAATIAAEVDGEITPETIRKHLYHPEIPDVDMVVRTSGEERISGFMLWRSSYAEFFFMKKYFPDIVPEDMDVIIKEYEKRQRRFGK